MSREDVWAETYDLPPIWPEPNFAAPLPAINLDPSHRALPIPTAPTQQMLPAAPPGPVPDAEGLFLGDRPHDAYCETCRLTPPRGYRNTEGTLFYCPTCYKGK